MIHMIQANEENGSESGENEDVGDEDKDDDMNDDNRLEDTPVVECENDEKEVVTKDEKCEEAEDKQEEEEEDSGDSRKEQELEHSVDKSSISSDTMPHHMDTTDFHTSTQEDGKTMNVKKEKDENSKKSSSSRPETPPLKRLMRQDPLPLFLQKKQHSPPKKLFKDGYYPHKFHIPPMALSAMSVIKNAPTHPKQTMIKSKMYSNKLPKTYHTPYIPSSPIAGTATSPSSALHLHHMQSSSSARSLLEEQPLDLSKKTGEKNELHKNNEHSANKSPIFKSSNGHNSSGGRRSAGGHPSSGVPSTLQSLQQRFGGNLHMRSVRKPISGLLPVMPDVPKSHSPMHLNSSHLKNSSTHFPKKSVNSNGSVAKSPRGDSPNHSSKLEKLEDSKSSSASSEKVPSPVIHNTDLNSNITTKDDSDNTDDDNKYTMHRCTCLKTFNTLYGLSLHLQDTGHLPASTKQAAIMDYPKLVRGQDMWLNQESEHTKRILRCMQCGESFKSLPMLTVHMMQTQHYTKIVTSEHGRRSHKCSAYCDREMDRECIFKCKVCNSTFSDMEGLANHMIMSGHHKKNILRSHNYLNDLAFRGRRKRYYSGDESFDGLGNPNMSSFLNYKRKCLSHSVPPHMNGHHQFADSPDSEPLEDSTISCENCGDRIETHFFVEHVRLCLKNRQRDLDKTKVNLYKDEISSLKSEKSHESQDLDEIDEESASMFEKPIESEEEEMDTKPDISLLDLSFSKEEGLVSSKAKEEELCRKKEHDFLEEDEREKEGNCDRGCEKLDKMKNTVKYEVSDAAALAQLPSVGNEDQTTNKDDVKVEKMISQSPKLREMKTEDSPRKSPVNQDEESEKSVESKYKFQFEEGHRTLKKEKKCERSDSPQSKKGSDLTKNLDIIDPGKDLEDPGDNSALQAMESFIQKSFSSKFDYHRGNMVFNTSEKTLLKPSIHREEKDHRHGALYRFEKYRKYFQQDETRSNGSVKKSSTEAQDPLNVCLQPLSVVSSAKDDLKKLEKMCESVRKAPSPSVNDSENVRSSSNSENGEILASKYLNCGEEVNESKDSKSGSSALDSLSSFVYGQPLNSEHPLDSLQKLITKTDLPKLLASSHSIKYLQQCESPDSVLPLNLSLKKGQDDDASDIMERDGFSDHDGSQHSGSESDSTVEYRCAACSRHFASKGSYRYHLSRCHLSSVKRYGIKEAFNMSPYVYLPLDHTAKFSKYYEMAQELASKGK